MKQGIILGVVVITIVVGWIAMEIFPTVDGPIALLTLILLLVLLTYSIALRGG